MPCGINHETRGSAAPQATRPNLTLSINHETRGSVAPQATRSRHPKQRSRHTKSERPEQV